MDTKSDRSKIRHPRVAGQFYPAEPVELTKTIAGYFGHVEKAEQIGPPLALICPHAGYMYSGQVAAQAYKVLEGRSYETVVVISPSHTAFFHGVSVYDGGTYRTPLGDIPIDIEFASKLCAVDPKIKLADDGHSGRGGRHEHALEVQLPFLQVVLGRFMLVPIIMGDQEHDTCKTLGDALGRYAEPGRTMIIASSDLSHFHPAKEARQLDASAEQAIADYTPYELLRRIDRGDCEACGAGPIAAAMIATKNMGGAGVQIVATANSGDVEPHHSDQVVGYLSAIIYRDPQESPEKVYEIEASIGDSATGLEDMYNDEERLFLKRVARKSIEHAVKGARYSELKPPTSRIAEKRGVFVTLHNAGELRGCIGYIEGIKPLVDAVREMAKAAACDDTRFTPVEPDEIDALDIEITVLSPLVKVSDVKEILVGRDGLMIRQGFQSGVLLPQVAVEHDWSRDTFLAETCVKAGLPADAWQSDTVEIYRFSAVIF